MPTQSITRLFQFLFVCLTLVGPLPAQEGVSGRVAGVITDLDDQPVAGATVSLRLAATPSARPNEVETDPSGRWSLANLAVGRWEIRVKARNFRTSQGWVDVRKAEPTPVVSVALRPLGEVTPIFATSSQSISNWIEMGNDLLEQGHPERARGEYEKALTVLPVASRPEVLRAVARTHYLQEQWEASVSSMEDALLIEPENETTRQLYRSVSIQLNRTEEAEDFLSALRGREAKETGPSPGEAVEDPLADETRMDELPVEPPIAGRKGRYRTRFDQESIQQSDPQAGRYELQEESFQVYVPEQDPPEAGYGLLVWISPLPFGGFARDEVREVLEEKGLIWIGADRSGNRRPLWYRVQLALDAVHNTRRYYDIDVERIYAAGYSGGGRVASTLAQLYSDVFRGGFSFFGCDYWGPVAIPHMPGAHWPAAYPEPSRSESRAVRQRSRFVLLTGELDFNRSQTKGTFQQMTDDGFKSVELVVIPGASHYHAVENEWFQLGIEFLDSAIESH